MSSDPNGSATIWLILLALAVVVLALLYVMVAT